MDQNVQTLPEEAPKKRNNAVIIAVIVVALLCCCAVAACAALYFGYDSLGDPLGIYGAIPRGSIPL